MQALQKLRPGRKLLRQLVKRIVQLWTTKTMLGFICHIKSHASSWGGPFVEGEFPILKDNMDSLSLCWFSFKCVKRGLQNCRLYVLPKLCTIAVDIVKCLAHVFFSSNLVSFKTKYFRMSPIPGQFPTNFDSFKLESLVRKNVNATILSEITLENKR